MDGLKTDPQTKCAEMKWKKHECRREDNLLLKGRKGDEGQSDVELDQTNMTAQTQRQKENSLETPNTILKWNNWEALLDSKKTYFYISIKNNRETPANKSQDTIYMIHGYHPEDSRFAHSNNLHNCA